jgi:outer membrane protein
MKHLKSLFLLGAALAVAVAAQAQPALRVATINVGQVLNTYYKAEEATNRLRVDQQKAQEQIEELNRQGNELVEGYKELVEQSRNTALSDDARSRAEADAQRRMEQIQLKQAEVQQFQANAERSLRQRQQTQQQLLLDEIRQSAETVAKAKGATLLLDNSLAPVVLFADPAYDITEEVSRELNKGRPAAPATSR